MKHFIAYFLTLFCTANAIVCVAQKHDTLSNVKVLALKEKNTATNSTPVQQLNNEQLQKINSTSVADAVKKFAGVQVKDYGGAGGLKTINVRSLGANNVAVFYDGMALSNAQAGQIDLGKISLQNIEQIELYNGNAIDLLLPARAYSNASLLNIKTTTGTFNKTEKKILSVKITQGSFGYITPSILFKTAIKNKIQYSLNAQYLSAKNNYYYTSYENNNQKERRKNSDIKSYNIEYDATYFINDSNKIKCKVFYYSSKRGLPGAIILYNNTGNQILNDNNFFVQTSWQNKINKKNLFAINAKYSYDKNYYYDPNYPNNLHFLENEFIQKEKYLSIVYKLKINKYLYASYASDYFNSSLKRTDIFADTFATPTRNSFLNNIALLFKNNKAEISANALLTSITEKVVYGNTAKKLQQLSPSIAVSVKPFFTNNFYVRSFYKHIFRAPTFNDLYYTHIGNTNLKPETVEQFNVGFTYSKKTTGFLKKILFTTDIYINNVHNKILAVPRQNLFQWSMQNVGIVKIKGLDATIAFDFLPTKKLNIYTKLFYTHQQALDLSNPNFSTYKTQLPYTPPYTAGASAGLQYKKIGFNYNMLHSSFRYRQGDATTENFLKSWSSSDFSFDYIFKENYKIIVEANNVFNTQYEIIKYYPMPKFNYRFTILATFKSKK